MSLWVRYYERTTAFPMYDGTLEECMRHQWFRFKKWLFSIDDSLQNDLVISALETTMEMSELNTFNEKRQYLLNY